MRSGRQNPVALESRTEAQVLRAHVIGLLEILVGFLVILPGLRVGALLIESLGLIARNSRGANTQNCQQEQSRTLQPCHQTVLM